MTQATHTPGPWTAEYSNYGDEIWFGGYGAGMWTVEPIGAYLDGASKENAHLIAAAPELLAALEALRGEAEMLRRQYGREGNTEWADRQAWLVEKADAAIAKAKGE